MLSFLFLHKDIYNRGMAKLTLNSLNERVDEIYDNICVEINKLIKKQDELTFEIKKNNTEINNIYKKLENTPAGETDKIDKINTTIFSLADKVNRTNDKNQELEKSLNIVANNVLKNINDIKALNDKVDNPPKKIATLKNLIYDINEIINKYE